MPFEEKSLECIECEESFVFTVGEQEFYQQREFTEPKRCKKCRENKRKAKANRRRGSQIYRSPAFEGSAPAHQQIRGGRGGYRRGAGDYRSPGFRERDEIDPTKDYRSPAFGEDAIKPEDEYRAPGFKEYETVDPQDEYRAPGFRENDGVDVRGEYRAPAYADVGNKYVDEKPEFAIVCSACGEEAMVPFLPEEKKSPMCRPCYRKKLNSETETRTETETETE